MTRTVKVYRLSARDAAFWGLDWDYETEEQNASGWYWDSWLDGAPCMELQGPYSTEAIAKMAAGVES